MVREENIFLSLNRKVGTVSDKEQKGSRELWFGTTLYKIFSKQIQCPNQQEA